MADGMHASRERVFRPAREIDSVVLNPFGINSPLSASAFALLVLLADFAVALLVPPLTSNPNPRIGLLMHRAGLRDRGERGRRVRRTPAEAQAHLAAYR